MQNTSMSYQFSFVIPKHAPNPLIQGTTNEPLSFMCETNLLPSPIPVDSP